MESAYFLIALGAVGLMGFANQRGGTCTVAAIEEIVAERRFGRLLALFEASLWVAGGLTLIAALGRLPVMPVSYAVGFMTIAGGALFGLGAFVNRACAFGSLRAWARATGLILRRRPASISAPLPRFHCRTRPRSQRPPSWRARRSGSPWASRSFFSPGYAPTDGRSGAEDGWG